MSRLNKSGAATHQLVASGQMVWVDGLTRPMLIDGTLPRLIDEDHVGGVTTNPTLFQAALAATDDYNDQIADLLPNQRDAKEIFMALAADDVAWACDLLRPRWTKTRGEDGWVSIEVDPHLADDAVASVAEAFRLKQMVERPNVLIKIPATNAGLRAVEEVTAHGISVNVTLIFGLRRHLQVIDAWMRGLERFRAIGGDLASVASVASFFVSRVDAETDARLDALGADPELKGKMGIANAKLAYQQYRQRFSGDRWESFASLGALPQRCLWASTSVKDPSERDVRYVEGLVGEHTITTIPVPTLQAFQDHGEVRRTLSANVEAAAGVYHAVAAAGVDHLDVSRTLERDGVRRFQQSFDELLAGIERERCHASRPSG